MKKIIYLLMIMVSLGFSPTAWVQENSNFDLNKAIARGDHASLAEYYRSQAKALKALSEQHAKMRDLYQKNHEHYKDFGQTLAHHCEDLRLQALQSSYQYEVLAREEEKLVKKP